MIFSQHLESQIEKSKTSGPITIFSNPNSDVSRYILDKWIPPDPRLNYDQVCFYGAHNSNSAYHSGYDPYAQQKWNIKEQLENGVRYLLPDLWTTEIKTNKECERQENETIEEYSKRATIRMCHEKCSINPLFRPKEFVKGILKLRGPKKQVLPPFEDALKIISEFLNKEENKDEVVTLYLENYTDTELLDYIIGEVPEFAQLVLTPNNKEKAKFKKEDWPTIGWMQKENKRIVIFNDFSEDLEKKEKSKYTFPVWQYVIENLYGTIDLRKAQEERYQSFGEWLDNEKIPKKLLMLNYFIEFPLPIHKSELKKFFKEFKERAESVQDNTIRIESLINLVYNEGLILPQSKNNEMTEYTEKYPSETTKDGYFSNITKGRFPNFIALDFVDKGNTMAIVNYINKLQAHKNLGSKKPTIAEKPEEQTNLEKEKRIIIEDVINEIIQKRKA